MSKIKKIWRTIRGRAVYPNRFLKFYYENKSRLIKERKKLYHKKRKAGICVRCNRKSLKQVVFCRYHRMKQKEYNKIARSRV